ITFTNTGKTTVILASAVSSGTGFTASGPSMPYTINPGKSVGFNVTFTPPAAAPDSGTLVLYNGGLTVNLNGTGTVGALAIAPGTLNFGNVAVGSTGTQGLSLSATGGDVTINSASSSSSQFALLGVTFPLTIPSGQTSTFNVSFTPKAAGTTSGNLSLAT